jgi:uncharacterized repeat protein (TIGR01451 family)
MKKALSILLALVTLLVYVTVPALAGPSEEEAMAARRIYAVGDLMSYLLYDGSPQGVVLAYYTGRSTSGEVVEYPAYCINPYKPGPSETSPYSVDTKDYISDPKVWGIVANGYLYKSIGELGVHTQEQAFYATKMALWTYINSWNVDSWTAANGEQSVTLTALKKIYAAGMAVNEIPQAMLVVAADQTKMELDALDPNYASQTYTVTANMEIRSYEVFLDGNIPDGAKITDLNNTPRIVFNVGERFKVVIPANQIENATGNFEVTVKSQLQTNAVLYGMSYDTTLQDFAVTRDPFDFQSATATAFYSTQNTFLAIVKLAAGTNTPLAGAVFKVTDAEGGVVGTFTTDSSGRVVVPLTKTGVFQVEEVTPPKGYALAVTSHQDVVVKWEQTAAVTFVNEKEPDLSLRKIDAASGEGIEGAVIRVAQTGGMAFSDVKTGAGGWAYITLSPGVYTATEIFVPEPYVLDSMPQTILLEAGKSAAITFMNTKKPGLIIWKYDEATGLPLAGAEFSVAKKGGSIVYEGITPPTGMIHLENLDPNQWYTITELAAPQGYLKTWESKDVYLEPGKTVEVKFDNRLRPALRIMKVDAASNEPLAGAKFKVQKTEDSTVSEYITGPDGCITIHDLDEAVYSVWEYEAPADYLLDSQHKDIKLEWGTIKTLIFSNKARPKLRILKIDAVTGQPLANAEFRVSKTEGDTVSEYITSETGEILIENLDEAVYKAEEFMPPNGYLLSAESKEILTVWGQTKTLKFDNVRKPVVVFLKINALTGQGISGATFKVEYEQPDGGLRNLGSYKTGSDGRIVIPQAEPGWYVFTEVLPAPGFSLPVNPVTRMYFAAGDNAYLSEFESYYTGGADAATTATPTTDAVAGHSGNGYYVQGEGYNWPLNSIVIKKTHALTGELLPGAVFELYRADAQVSGIPGTAIGRYTTDNSGIVVITGLESGYYVVKEVQAPQNFLLSENSQQSGYLKADGTTVLEFTFANYPYGSLLIAKIDALTSEPLAGARFKVTDATGAVIGNTGGEYVSDSRGEILIPNVKPGAVVITEIQAPTHYAINTTPQTVQIGTDGKTYKATFENYPYGAIVIRKLDSVSKEALAGVEFRVTDSKGAVVGNSNGVFLTDQQGLITIPNLPQGNYVLTETKTLSTHILENQTRTVAVDYGQTCTLEFYNQPKSGLQIVKLDSATRQPIAGVEFTITKMSGEKVLNEFNGYAFQTDAAGKIYIPNLADGYYTVTETRTKEGYLLDSEPKTVWLQSGKPTVLEVLNTPMSGWRLIKIDSVTKQGIYNVEFMLFDSNNRGVGAYYTDNNGIIDFTGILAEGRYTLRETRPAANYYADNVPRTVEFKPGKVTDVVWENTAQAGQIQILKLSGDENEINGLPAGTPLAGATFEVYAYKSGNLADRFVSGSDGRAVSKPLPLGRYIVKEVTAPPWYKLSDQTLDVELEFATQILKLEYRNYSANTGVTIRKTGPAECMPGDTISYTIKELRNTSAVPLTDYYWRDTLPADAVRLTKIVTGTYSQSLKYKILITTNKGDQRIIADNLSTTKNNVIDCAGVSLGLKSDEYVTSFTLLFGTVKAGFSIVEQPQIYAQVLADLPNGYEFANKVDTGGKYNAEWVVGNATSRSRVYNPAKSTPLPRTGY